MIGTKKQELKQLLLAEAALVEKMVSMAIGGLYKLGSAFKDEVLAFEDRVNQLELEVDSKCVSLIALFQPEAKDLREIMMIFRINYDLERLGDQAVNIAESAAQLVGNPVIEAIPELLDMKDITLKMLKSSLDAFSVEDAVAAKKVCDSDNLVDEYNRNIYKHLVQLIKDNPQQVDLYLHILRIAKNLERIADLSTNIAENAIYLSEGRIIKHHAEDDNKD